MQGISAIRWTKIAKYLVKNHSDDVSIDVLTTKKDFDSPERAIKFQRDVMLQRDMRYFDHYYDVSVDKWFRFAYLYKRKVIGAGQHFYSADDAFRHDFKAKMKIQVRYLYNRYSNYAIAAEVWKFIKDKLDSYDCVISSYLPMWPLMLCSKMKRAQKNLKWIADFRDTCGRLNVDMTDYAPWHSQYVEKRVAQEDAVFAVNDFIDTHTNPRVPRYTITNGYDPEETAAPEKPDSFDFVYTGSLYGKQQDFGVLYRALNELLEEGKIQAGDVRVVYAGSHGGQAQIIAERNNGAQFFVNLNSVPRQRARELQRKAAILLQSAFNIEGDYCAWTGKMYEYMAAKKPIVCIVNGDIPHSMPSEHMGQLGGVCYEACRHEETYGVLKEYILQKYEEWKQTGDVTVSQDESYVEQYSYSAIAERVWTILHEL